LLGAGDPFEIWTPFQGCLKGSFLFLALIFSAFAACVMSGQGATVKNLLKMGKLVAIEVLYLSSSQPCIHIGSNC
jgi:hypothetical protein